MSNPYEKGSERAMIWEQGFNAAKQEVKGSVTDFDTFWKAYPNKTHKGTALAAWKKLKPPLADVLVTLAWKKKSTAWADADFIPHPASWLNALGWLDEKPFDRAEAKKALPPIFICPHTDITTEKKFQIRGGIAIVSLTDKCQCGQVFPPQTYSLTDLKASLKLTPGLEATRVLLAELTKFSEQELGPQT